MTENLYGVALSREDPKGMSEENIREEIAAILNFFDEAARDDPWGWDWETMRVLFPAQYARGRSLVNELKRRHCGTP
jgi:hypothetical protein